MAAPRLIVLDLDGTALDYEPETAVAPSVRDVLARAISAGTIWCMNSDRPAETQMQLALELPVELRPRSVLAVQRHVYWYDDERGYYRGDREWNRAADRVHIDLWRRLMPNFVEWADMIEADFTVRECYVDNTAFAFCVEREETPALRESLEAWLAPYPDAFISGNLEWVFVVHRSFSKGWILSRAAERLGVSRDEILAVGDGFNDLAMLDGAVAGRVGCPADASDEALEAVRAAGGTVASAPGPEGTAEIIRAALDDAKETSP